MTEFIEIVGVHDDAWLLWYENGEPRKRLLTDDEKLAAARLQDQQRHDFDKLLLGFRDAAS